jgi:hypothetical protein
MSGRVELHPHPRGPWLLRIGGRSFAVPPAVGRCLSARGQLPQAAALLLKTTGRGPSRRSRLMWLRIPLFSSRSAMMIAGRLVFMAGWTGLLVSALLGAGLLGCGLHRELHIEPRAFPLALGLMILLNLLHEFGHAAALLRGGYPPGRIGLGVLLIMPVLYCDVSAVNLLPRRDRLRVDAAGICFQAFFGGLLAAAGALFDQSALRLAAAGSVFSMLWSLLPFMKVDGYWLLCDALGVKDLGTGAAAGKSAWVRLSLLVYRLLYGIFLWRLALALLATGQGVWRWLAGGRV